MKHVHGSSLTLLMGLGLLLSPQTSVLQCVSSSGSNLGQSGDCSAHDAAKPPGGLPWRPAERPPQAGGGVWSPSGPSWCGRGRVEGGCPWSPTVLINMFKCSLHTDVSNKVINLQTELEIHLHLYKHAHTKTFTSV